MSKYYKTIDGKYCELSCIGVNPYIGNKVLYEGKLYKYTGRDGSMYLLYRAGKYISLNSLNDLPIFISYVSHAELYKELSGYLKTLKEFVHTTVDFKESYLLDLLLKHITVIEDYVV